MTELGARDLSSLLEAAPRERKVGMSARVNGARGGDGKGTLGDSCRWRGGIGEERRSATHSNLPLSLFLTHSWPASIHSPVFTYNSTLFLCSHFAI